MSTELGLCTEQDPLGRSARVGGFWTVRGWRGVALCLVGALFAVPPCFAGVCGDNTPGRAVPECRLQNGGAEADCGAAGAVRLWPDGLRPGLPDEILPDLRDSTDYNSTTIPGEGSGHELFHSLDIVGNSLYVTYNAGIQIWNIGGNRAEDPQYIVGKDGWMDDFFEFQEVGENDFYIDDVAAIDAGATRLVAVSGRSTVGISLWEHRVSPFSFEQLYQDIDNRSQEVRVANYAGRDWAFAAGTLGIFVYDMTHARDMAFPCVDQNDVNLCPGVWEGKIGTTNISLHLDLIERNGRIYIVKSGGNALPVEIWETSDPDNPGNAQRRFTGLNAGARGVSFFEIGGVVYLGVVEKNGTAWRLRIYDVDDCLTTQGCTSLGSPLYSRNVGAAANSAQFLRFSTSGSTPYLYYGLNEINIDGRKLELLLDLSGFPGSVSEVTEQGGGVYTDSCSGNQVDYWGDYYPKNGWGMGNHRPMVGKFNGDYFYRASYGMLDVHVKTVTSAAVFVEGGPPGGVGFVDVDYTFDASAVACVPDPVWNWSASGGGQVSGNGATVQISWPTAGAKTVSVSNSDCAASPAVINVEIQEAAAGVGDVSVDPADPRICQTVTLTAVDVTGLPPFDPVDWIIRDDSGGIVDSDSGTALSFDWVTDDTTPAGTYNAEVIVANDANPGGASANTNFVLGEATLAFDGSTTYDGAPGAGVIDIPVQFRARTTGASTWTWDFGDGTMPVTYNSRLAGENPQHTYTAGGNYTVELTIDNCVGATDSDQVAIEIVEEELQVLSFGPGCPFGNCDFCPGETVFFTVQTLGQPQSFSYDWYGDGNFTPPTSNPQPSFIFCEEGMNILPRVKVVSGTQEIIEDSSETIDIFDKGDCEPLPPECFDTGPPDLIFADGFESGNVGQWTLSMP